MLEDRDYMRQPAYYRPRLSFTVALLIANAVAFVIELVTCGYPPLLSSNNYFALSVKGLEYGYVWQLLTYQFMHVGFLHILLNCWAIYVFGQVIEDDLGPQKFLALYFSSGVIGGLTQVLGALVWPTHIGGAVVGASAAALGLVAAFATLYPERELTLLLFFFLPVTLRAKYLLWGTALLSVFCILFPFSRLTLLMGGNIAHAAHLGGMLTGIVFVWQFVQGRWHWPQWGFSPSRRTAPREFVVTRAGRGKFWQSAAGKTDEEPSADDFVSSEVDPILDKISAHGIQSLTAREREILEKARNKMTKR
ncbi:MAG TPA: rhomboid family intramembrane serine protease [Candidatus Saccharimonadales bacterium]|nr:rhomboid family intramembrane serine protease [Candidatus Saccharimonadales bacterium]